MSLRRCSMCGTEIAKVPEKRYRCREKRCRDVVCYSCRAAHYMKHIHASDPDRHELHKNPV